MIGDLRYGPWKGSDPQDSFTMDGNLNHLSSGATNELGSTLWEVCCTVPGQTWVVPTNPPCRCYDAKSSPTDSGTEFWYPED
eukprot:2137344-Amphidinium_carterae.1